MKIEALETRTEEKEPVNEEEEIEEKKPNVEEVVLETKFERFASKYLDLRENNPYCKFGFHIFGICTFVTIGFNTPYQILLYPSLDLACVVIYLLNFLIYFFDMVIKLSYYGLSNEKSYFKNIWNIAEFIFMIFLVLAAIFQILAILGIVLSPFLIHSFSRIPLAVNFILLIPDYVNINLGEVFTPEALVQMGKVLFFSIYFYVIFTLLGVQLVGGVRGVCLKNGTNKNNIGDMRFTIPLLHCNLNDINYGYICPTNFSCYDQTVFGFADGNLYFDGIFNGIMFVYQGSIQDGWSTQFIYSIQSNGILAATLYYLSLILFSAWLVRNVFVAVVTQILSGALAYEPTPKELNLQTANFGLTLYLDNEQLALKDVSKNTKVESNFKVILKFILKSVYFSAFISIILIVDVILLAFVGMLTPWELVLAIIFLIEPCLKLYAFGLTYLEPLDWIVGEFLFPVLNLIAVILNFCGYYQLDVIYALRVLRIISVHGFIFDYIKRILGNYARFGASLVLAISFLIVLSSLSLQLFCGIATIIDPTVPVFSEFPTSFLVIFIIFLQGGAFGTMLSLATAVSSLLYYFVVLFFVGCHFFSNTIMMSIFITFILANLELTEEEIKEMQKEISVPFDALDDFAGSSKETQVIRLSDEINDDFVLPFRFKVYKLFKNSALTVPKPLELRDPRIPDVNRNFMELYLSNDFPIFDERFYVAKNFRPDVDPSKNYIMTKNFDFTEEDFRANNLNFDYPSVIEMIKILNTDSSPLHTPIPNAKAIKKTSISSAVTETGKQTDEEKEILELQKKISTFVAARARLIQTLREQHPYIDKSVFVFDKNSTVRKICGLILNSRYHNKNASSTIGEIFGSQSYFEWLMIILTLVSSGFMMLETAENMVFDQRYSTIMEYVFVSVSCFEVIIRLITQGLIFTPSAICNDPSDILNIFIAVINVFHTFYFIQVSPTNNFINLNSYTMFAIFLRVSRCIRPFRVVLISKDLFRVIILLLGGWKNILKVLCLLLILLLFFSYFGYLSFRGRLTRCNDDSIDALSNCTSNYYAFLSAVPISTALNATYDSTTFSVIVPRANASHSRFMFDDFFSAYFSSYIMMTLDSWSDGMDYIKAKVGSWVILYFYAYVFFANLIGVSMFIGVVCQSYNIKTGVALLTKDQRNWSDLTQRIELTSPVFIPRRPLQNCRAQLYDIIMSFIYRVFHSLMIFVSPTALLIYPLNDDSYTSQQYICYIIILVCNIYFLIDLILKIVAFGFLTYFSGLLSKLDTLLTILSIVTTSLGITSRFRGYVVLNFIMIAVVTLQLVLLSTRWDALKNLMLTFIMSVIKSLTTITVMFIIMVVYAMMGNVLFGRVKFGLTLNRYFNYRTSFNALFILFILATGDNWSAYLIDSSIEEPFCTYDSEFPVQSDCGGKIAAIVYFLTYLLLIQQIILNLFIANVLSNFAVFCASDEVNGRFKPSDIPTYLKIWNNFDIKQDSKISRNYARMLCLEYFYAKGYTTTADWFLLAQLYEEIDRNIKKAYLSEDEDHKDDDSYKTLGNISFRDLMLILATRLTNIMNSFQTNQLLARIMFEEDVAENVSSSLIWKWYKYMTSLRKERILLCNLAPKIIDDSKTIRLPTERIGLSTGEETDGFPLTNIKFDPESLKRELDRIYNETPTSDPEKIEEFCTWWHDEYIALTKSKKS